MLRFEVDIYIYRSIYTWNLFILYFEAQTLLKKGPFQLKQGSFGFQVYVYIYIDQSSTLVSEVDAEKLGASRTPHGRSLIGPSKRTRARRGMKEYNLALG